MAAATPSVTPAVMPTIAPEPTEISQPFWDACCEGRLVMQACEDCGELAFYPVRMCPHCGGGRLDWQEVSGRARIHSLTVVMRPSAPVFAESVPYVVALVELDEGPIMMTNIVGEGAREAGIGDPVRVQFEAVGEVTLPRFRLADDAPTGGASATGASAGG